MCVKWFNKRVSFLLSMGGVHGKGAIFSEGGMCGQGGHVWSRGACVGGSCVAGKTATAADSAHSTGIRVHVLKYCLWVVVFSLFLFIYFFVFRIKNCRLLGPVDGIVTVSVQKLC